MAAKYQVDNEVIPERETRRILQRVYAKLRSDGNEPVNTKVSDRLAKFTGLSQHIIQRVAKNETIAITHKEFERADILRVLLSIYIDRKVVPTTTQFFNACQDYLPEYMDIAGFRKLLFKLDFVWKKLPNYTFVVLERPEVTYERYKYLKTVTDCFNDVYFIEENAFVDYDVSNYFDFNESLNKKDTTKVIYAISCDNIIYNIQYKHEYTTESFKNYIISELIPQIHKPSVIIFNNAEHHCELSSNHSDLPIDSLRCEMTECLDRNNIPYEKNMSKVELFSLIENCTDTTCYKYLVDNIILSMGHTPLRIPDHLFSLTPGQSVCHAIKKKLANKALSGPMSTRIFSILPSITPDLLVKSFEMVFYNYEKMYDMDLQADQCLDSLLQKMDQMSSSQKLEGGNDDSDLPSLSEDSD